MTVRGIAVLVAVALLGIAGATGGRADDEGAPFVPEPLGKIGDGDAADLAAGVTVLTNEDLMALGARDLGEALAYVAAITITTGRINPELQEAAASVRGISPAATRVLVDGVPIGGTDAATVDLASIPLDHVARIRVVRGAASALYGGDAAGGVIEVITRTAARPLAVRTGADYGSGNDFDYRLALGGRAQWFSGALTASHRQREAVPLPSSFDPTARERGDVLNHTALRRDHCFGKAGFAIGETASIAIEGDYLQAERDVPVDVDLLSPRYLRVPSWRRWNVALLAGVDTRTWFRGTLRAFTGAQDSKLALYLDSEYQDPLEDRLRRADAIGGDVQLFFDFGRWSLIKLRGSFERDHTAIDLPSVPAEEFVVARQSHALEWEMRPVPEVALLAGASYDLVEGVQSDRGTTAGDLQRINPLGSVTYLPVPDVSITGSYARKTRFPSIEEAYAGPGAEPGLAAEQSDFYELAVRGRVKGTFEGRLAGFRQDIVGVVRTRNAGRRDARLDNAGVVRLQGGEVEADVTPTAGLRLRLAYAFVAAQDLWRDADDDAVDYVPAHRSVLDARYVLPFGLGFGLWSQVTSERHYLAEGQDKLLPWTMVHNVRAFYRYKNNIEAYVAMTNLADAEIEQVPGFPEAGRAFRGGLDVRF